MPLYSKIVFTIMRLFTSPKFKSISVFAISNLAK
nr:MAG TPA: hypothetical protein [Caudoviricetes sp.]